MVVWKKAVFLYIFGRLVRYKKTNHIKHQSLYLWFCLCLHTLKYWCHLLRCITSARVHTEGEPRTTSVIKSTLLGLDLSTAHGLRPRHCVGVDIVAESYRGPVVHVYIHISMYLRITQYVVTFMCILYSFMNNYSLLYQYCFGDKAVQLHCFVLRHISKPTQRFHRRRLDQNGGNSTGDIFKSRFPWMPMCRLWLIHIWAKMADSIYIMQWLLTIITQRMIHMVKVCTDFCEHGVNQNLIVSFYSSHFACMRRTYRPHIPTWSFPFNAGYCAHSDIW